MEKDELTEAMRKLNFGEALRLYAHGTKTLELYKPFEDLVTKGVATVNISMERGDVVIQKVEAPEKSVTELEVENKELKETVKKQEKRIKTLELAFTTPASTEEIDLFEEHKERVIEDIKELEAAKKKERLEKAGYHGGPRRRRKKA